LQNDLILVLISCRKYFFDLYSSKLWNYCFSFVRNIHFRISN